MPDSSYQSLPDHVTMPLLTLVTRQSLDQDYAYVAERRAAGEEEPASRRGVVALVVVLLGFGVLAQYGGRPDVAQRPGRRDQPLLAGP